MMLGDQTTQREFWQWGLEESTSPCAPAFSMQGSHCSRRARWTEVSQVDRSTLRQTEGSQVDRGVPGRQRCPRQTEVSQVDRGVPGRQRCPRWTQVSRQTEVHQGRQKWPGVMALSQARASHPAEQGQVWVQKGHLSLPPGLSGAGV